MHTNRFHALLFVAALSTMSLASQGQQSIVKKAQKTSATVYRKTRSAVKTATHATKKAVKSVMATPLWPKLKAAYDYDGSAAPEVKEEPQDSDKAVVINISFTGPNGKPVNGTFMRPKAEGVYPCALVMHGLTNNKEIAIKLYGQRLVDKGVAILALDAPEHGKQQAPNKKYWNDQVYTVAVHQGDRNYRRALDYLTARPDIDKERIGSIGYSMGAIMSSILGSVDGRIKALALCVGGDPFIAVARARQHEEDYDVSPSLYLPHFITRPVILFNGKTDPVIVPPAAILLQNAAQPPKKVVWFAGTHDVPASIRAQAVDWLASKLGAVTPGKETAPKAGAL